MRRICVVTAGHLSTCPRMLKAADALSQAGHRVRVVSTCFVPWARDADRELRASRPWASSVVDYCRESNLTTYIWSGLRRRSSLALARGVGASRAPRSLAARAYGRVYPELVNTVISEPADLVYGGGGSLAAAVRSATRMGVPVGLDLEDFHSSEQEETPEGLLDNQLAECIERAALPEAAFLTTSSEAIGSAYAAKYGVWPISIHNVFSLPETAPDIVPRNDRKLRLYWFSQTIGPGRGLEDAISAMGLAGIPGELHLRGVPAGGYLESLLQFGRASAPTLRILHHDIGPPESMVELCKGYDVGLALEPGFSVNNKLALSNKALTYILAGLAVVFTDTEGQRTLARDLREGAILYRPGDIESLARDLRHWAEDKDSLAKAQSLCWEAARSRWHWEHAAERGALVEAVAGVLGV